MTIDLSERSGLPVAVDPVSARLDLGDGLMSEENAVRDLAAAREVYAAAADGPPLYFMANGLLPAGKRDPDPRLRYELTSLRPGTIGRELVKTMGHVHAPVVGGDGHPELYEVLAGHGAFPLFRPVTDSPESWECVLVEAGPGQRFVIPPGWHHLAINAGKEAMVFADIVAREVQPDYRVPRERAGAPIRVGADTVGWNALYEAGGTLVRVAAPELPIPVDLAPGPLYPQFAADPARFRFLADPGVCREVWRAFDRAVAEAPKTTLQELPQVEWLISG